MQCGTRQSQLYLSQPITKARCQPVRGHVSYPIHSPIAIRVGLCISLKPVQSNDSSVSTYHFKGSLFRKWHWRQCSQRSEFGNWSNRDTSALKVHYFVKFVSGFYQTKIFTNNIYSWYLYINLISISSSTKMLVNDTDPNGTEKDCKLLML